jgi:adenylate cyclase
MDKAPHWRTAADPLTEQAKPTLAAVREDLARVPLARRIVTVVFVIFAIFLARSSWDLKVADRDVPGVTAFMRNAERALYDTRALTASLRKPVEQDKRIILIPFTPDTQRTTGERSPLDRTTLANALTNIDKMGAKSIGIDILIDQPQPDDALLIKALHDMKTPVWLGFATNAHNSFDVDVWQQEFMENFVKQIDNPRVRRTSIRLEADNDNVMRNWPAQYRDLPPFMPVAMTGKHRAEAYRGSVLYRAPVGFGTNDQREVFTSLPIDLFATPEGASMLGGEVKGKYVLIGGDLPDLDQFDTPASLLSNESTTGLKIHATLIAQLLDGRLPGRVNRGALWIVAIFVVLCGTFTSMIDIRPGYLTLVIAGQLGFFAAVPFLFELQGIDTQGLPAFGWIAGWLLAYMATEATVKAMGSDQKRFAQSALGKYLPRDIAAQILKDPNKLSLRGERLPIFTLFTDIQGFTNLSTQLPAETMASILNAYLEGMSNIVLDHGGTIDKFVGDAVVAFWGAPIARPDDGERAVAAALAMLEFTRNFGKDNPDRARLGRTRIGLHHGDAIVGNFGGEGRISYTALGDAMNTAARLEGANKYLKSAALISDDVRKIIDTSDILRPMGRIVLSGRPAPIIVWEPAAEMDPEVRKELTRLWEQFDGGDKEALHAIEAIAAAHPDDPALSAFAYRLLQAGPGGHFVLGEK